MTDIVDRLRTVDISWNQEGEWCAEAADEIIKLREDKKLAFELMDVFIKEMKPHEAANKIERLRLANSDLQMWFDYAKTECDNLQAEVLRLREVLQKIAEIACAELKEK